LSRADDDDAGAAGIKERRNRPLPTTMMPAARIKERRNRPLPTTMMPAARIKERRV
jgi:hypothetical protein